MLERLSLLSFPPDVSSARKSCSSSEGGSVKVRIWVERPPPDPEMGILTLPTRVVVASTSRFSECIGPTISARPLA